MKKLLLAVVVFAMVAGVASAEERCSLCGMKIDESQRQSFVLTTKDGKKQRGCNEGCAVALREKSKKDIQTMEAVDYNTGKLLNAFKAFYVKGSDVPPTMGAQSYLAFADKKAAEKFQKEHGGTVVAVDDLFRPEGHEGHSGHSH